MRTYVIALAAGLLVGVVYGLLNVRSPAPPVVALIGLFGILVGEQVVPAAKRLLDRETLTGDDVAALSRGETLPPRAISPPPSAPALATPVLHPKTSKPPLFGGPEVAPA